jgi:hypothetical protein
MQEIPINGLPRTFGPTEFVWYKNAPWCIFIQFRAEAQQTPSQRRFAVGVYYSARRRRSEDVGLGLQNSIHKNQFHKKILQKNTLCKN